MPSINAKLQPATPKSWAPYVLSLLRIMAALLLFEYGTLKLFDFPVAPDFPMQPIYYVAGVFEHAHRRKHYLAPAADVSRITTEAVHLSVDSATSDKYEEFEQLHVSRLGLTGIFRWKHFGWKDSNE